LILPYNYYQGDTLQNQNFIVSQLVDDASLDATATYYNRTTPTPMLKSTVLGQVQNVKVRPVKNNYLISGAEKFDTLRIPIVEPIFVNFIKSQRDLTIKDNVLIGTGFKNKIRGFALTSEGNKSAAIVGFAADRTILRIYYSYKYSYTLRNVANTADSIRVTVDTTKSNNLYVGLYTRSTGVSNNARFNKITTNRIGGIFAKLSKTTDALPFSQSNNLVALQSSAGLAVKLNFPSLLKLKERKDIAINKAELVLEPNASNYSVPSDLVLLESTPTNRPVRNTINGDGSLLFVVGEGSTASYVSKSNSYTFNITTSLQNILSGRNKTNGWLLSANTFANSSASRGPISGRSIVSSEVDRAIFENKKIKMKLYYTYVNK
jgi:hypothetical protein